MTTEKQKSANRQNALVSTGPVSEEGKAISARNAVRHGIFSKEIVINKGEPREREIEFWELHDNLHRDLKPEGQMESLLVEKIAANYWRLRRVLRYETGEVRLLIDEHIRTSLGDELSVFTDSQEELFELKFFSINDEITEEDIKKQKDRLQALEEDLIDYTKDEETIEFVLKKRLHVDISRATAEQREQAIEYLRNLSPQQKGKIHRDLVWLEVRKGKEMRRIVDWQRRFDAVQLTRSIPSTPDLDKVIKYEGALERSIFKNLMLLKELQKGRKNLDLAPTRDQNR